MANITRLLFSAFIGLPLCYGGFLLFMKHRLATEQKFKIYMYLGIAGMAVGAIIAIPLLLVISNIAQSIVNLALTLLILGAIVYFGMRYLKSKKI